MAATCICMLADCLRLNGLDASVSDGWPKDEAELRDVKTIVVYTSPAAELLLDRPQRDEVDRVMKRGIGLVTIHGLRRLTSFSFLPVLDEADDGRGLRTSLVNDSTMGLYSIREGPWKLILGQGGEGHYSKEPAAVIHDNAEPPGQLYNLDDDLGERENRYLERPEVVARLTDLLRKIQQDERSRPR